MRTLRNVFYVFVGLAIAVGSVFGLIALGKAIFGGQEVSCPDCEVCEDPIVVTKDDETPSENSISCVKRMEFGEESNFFTETWDSETRVWIIKQKSTCTGPYCFDYSGCENPEETIRLQPFWLGYERNPVDGGVFRICENFEGDCSR